MPCLWPAKSRARFLRPSARALVSRLHRGVGTLFLLRDAVAARPLHGQVSPVPRAHSNTSRRSTASAGFTAVWTARRSLPRSSDLHRQRLSHPNPRRLPRRPLPRPASHVLLGALTMAAGHFLMAFEAAFLFALLCLVLGCGMFKGNIASQVGSLYKPEDLRRADAFQIFYLGINAGVIASPLIVGTLGEVYGWHYGFAAAGVGMLLATGIYLLARNICASDSKTRRAPPRPRPERNSPGATGAPSSRSFSSSRCWRSRSSLTTKSSTPISSGATSSSTSSSWAKSCPPPGSSPSTQSSASASSRSSPLLSLVWQALARTRRSHQAHHRLRLLRRGMPCASSSPLPLRARAKKSASFGRSPSTSSTASPSPISAHKPRALRRYAPKAINATIIGLYYLAFFSGNTSSAGSAASTRRWRPRTSGCSTPASPPVGPLLRNLQIRRRPLPRSRARTSPVEKRKVTDAELPLLPSWRRQTPQQGRSQTSAANRLSSAWGEN